MTTINYVRCIRCNQEWAYVDEDGLCENCQSAIQIELAIVDLDVSIDRIEDLTKVNIVNLPNEDLEKYKQCLVNSLNKIDNLLKKTGD